MDAKDESDPRGGKSPVKNPTTVEPRGDREVVVTRTFDAPARLVFEAWSKAELLKQWWVPRSLGAVLLSCEADVRVGGSYRLVFKHPAFPEPMAFFGTYTEVVPHSRITWTNEESGEDGAITTVTLEEKDGKTRLVLRDLYRSKAARDGGMGSGAYDGMSETFEQLAAMLAA